MNGGAPPPSEVPRLLGTERDLSSFEKRLRANGHPFVAGTDEVGRGALAGPVVAAAVILPDDFDTSYLKDSKKLTARAREELYAEITARAVAWATAAVSSTVIDRVNILTAALRAMANACRRLTPSPSIVLVDGRFPVPLAVKQRAVVGGDGRCACIAAASVVAKVTRDRMMARLDAKYPGYGFAQHKGYGTADHLAAIAAFGPSPVHRRSFKPFSDEPTAPIW